jgi:hypothetical protein
MKNLWIIVLAVFVIACIASQEDDDPTLSSVWFEGCEYVKTGGSGGGITHKGNCRNSEH